MSGIDVQVEDINTTKLAERLFTNQWNKESCPMCGYNDWLELIDHYICKQCGNKRIKNVGSRR